MKNITFYSLDEKKPNNNQEIWYVKRSEFYNTYEFQYGTVEYVYEELDKNGSLTGNSYFDGCPQKGDEDYDPKFKYQLYYVINGESLSDQDLWASAVDIDKELFEND